MDIDCDGAQSPKDPRCGSSTDTQSVTAFQSEVREASGGAVDDLNASIHPYVVFGNEGNYSPTFDPKKHGVQHLSVMAVVCGDNLVCQSLLEFTPGETRLVLIAYRSMGCGATPMVTTVLRWLAKQVFLSPPPATEEASMETMAMTSPTFCT